MSCGVIFSWNFLEMNFFYPFSSTPCSFLLFPQFLLQKRKLFSVGLAGFPTFKILFFFFCFVGFLCLVFSHILYVIVIFFSVLYYGFCFCILRFSLVVVSVGLQRCSSLNDFLLLLLPDVFGSLLYFLSLRVFSLSFFPIVLFSCCILPL